MEKVEFLDSSLTPSALIALCEGRTDFQLQDTLAPCLGKWLMFRGRLKYMTAAGAEHPDVIATATVEAEGRAEVFCVFTKNFEYASDLARIGVDDLVTFSGQVISIRRSQIQLNNCMVSSVIPKDDADLMEQWRREKEEARLAAQEPAHAFDLAPSDPPPSQKAHRKQDLPLLPNQIAEAWADWFKGNAPKVTREAAEASAAQMFPNHNFSRERIRDLIEPAKQGQRPKNN